MPLRKKNAGWEKGEHLCLIYCLRYNRRAVGICDRPLAAHNNQSISPPIDTCHVSNSSNYASPPIPLRLSPVWKWSAFLSLVLYTSSVQGNTEERLCLLLCMCARRFFFFFRFRGNYIVAPGPIVTMRRRAPGTREVARGWIRENGGNCASWERKNRKIIICAPESDRARDVCFVQSRLEVRALYRLPVSFLMHIF